MSEPTITRILTLEQFEKFFPSDARQLMKCLWDVAEKWGLRSLPELREQTEEIYGDGGKQFFVFDTGIMCFYTEESQKHQGGFVFFSGGDWKDLEDVQYDDLPFYDPYIEALEASL